MTNWYGAARSNYFEVKDAEAFKQWVDNTPSLGYWQNGDSFAIYSDCPDSGGWPSGRYERVEEVDDDDFTEDWVDIDLPDELSKHLTEGQVAVLMEAGAEKLRFISGWAVAVNHEGKTVMVSLSNIYDLAEKAFGVTPTDASY